MLVLLFFLAFYYFFLFNNTVYLFQLLLKCFFLCKAKQCTLKFRRQCFGIRNQSFMLLFIRFSGMSPPAELTRDFYVYLFFLFRSGDGVITQYTDLCESECVLGEKTGRISIFVSALLVVKHGLHMACVSLINHSGFWFSQKCFSDLRLLGSLLRTLEGFESTEEC